MKVWLATSHNTGYVTAYDSYETLMKDLSNLHEHELFLRVDIEEDWRPIATFKQVVDAWIDPAQMSEDWWHWYSEYYWRNYDENVKEELTTRVTITVKNVIEAEDFEN